MEVLASFNQFPRTFVALKKENGVYSAFIRQEILTSEGAIIGNIDGIYLTLKGLKDLNSQINAIIDYIQESNNTINGIENIAASPNVVNAPVQKRKKTTKNEEKS